MSAVLAPPEPETDRWRRPPAFPPDWADAWGDDACGLWADFAVAGVVQRMRWIEPGTFWMGSPDDQPERYDREGPRHRVRLTQGFWLADTACTQALWQAVTGQNPSHFKGDDALPVEQVSWDDVQAFLQRVPALCEGCSPVLPTEAQWEYACRAGSETPFSFGGQITPALANYDGNYPYAGGAKGEYRGRTVPVKSLPRNAWGLYQMHGNVWEWCADGLREYAKTAREGEAIDDPEGPGPDQQGAFRAVRGGSWFFDARFVRSAYRIAYQRGNRLHSLGFRVALRS
jgi:formylglycine-generating enzyme required for sulfatase activity